MNPALRFYELGGHPDAVALSLETALDDITNAEFFADLVDIRFLIAIGERGISRDDVILLKPRQVGDDFLDDAVAEISIGLIPGQSIERQYGDRGFCPTGAAPGRPADQFGDGAARPVATEARCGARAR